jgi:hypothetical protein
MKIVLRLILLAAVVAAGVWLWILLFPSPEKIVRKRLAQVAVEVSFNGGENPLVIAARAETLADRFSTNVEIHLDAPGDERLDLNGRAEITQAAAQARMANLKSLKVEFPDVSVTVAPDKQAAVADVAVEVQASGQKDFSVQEVKFTFQKFGRDWLITRVQSVRAPS